MIEPSQGEIEAAAAVLREELIAFFGDGIGRETTERIAAAMLRAADVALDSSVNRPHPDDT